MWAKYYGWIIGACSGLFSVTVVTCLHPALVALILSSAVSVIGIAVERERRRNRGND